MLYMKDKMGNFVGRGNTVMFCVNNKLRYGVIDKVCPNKVAIKFLYAKSFEHKVYIDHSNVVSYDVKGE